MTNLLVLNLHNLSHLTSKELSAHGKASVHMAQLKSICSSLKQAKRLSTPNYCVNPTLKYTIKFSQLYTEYSQFKLNCEYSIGKWTQIYFVR